MMSVFTSGCCHQRRLRGLPAGGSRLTSRFDMCENSVVDFVDYAALAQVNWIPAPRFCGDKFTPAKAGVGMT